MQFCQEHWDMLRAALDARGLTHLVSKTGEEAARRAEAGVPDPLLSAYMAIIRCAVEDRGQDVMHKGCIMCQVKAHDETMVKDWIDGAADDQLKAARTSGLIATH